MKDGNLTLGELTQCFNDVSLKKDRAHNEMTARYIMRNYDLNDTVNSTDPNGGLIPDGNLTSGELEYYFIDNDGPYLGRLIAFCSLIGAVTLGLVCYAKKKASSSVEVKGLTENLLPNKEQENPDRP